ncbi:hypothetical protein pb186bvf_019275, partial [Paramecium bursaria]
MLQILNFFSIYQVIGYTILFGNKCQLLQFYQRFSLFQVCVILKQNYTERQPSNHLICMFSTLFESIHINILNLKQRFFEKNIKIIIFMMIKDNKFLKEFININMWAIQYIVLLIIMSNGLIFIDLLENQWKFIINICMESLPCKRFSRVICKCCLNLCQIRNRKCFLLSEKYFQEHYLEIKQIYYNHKIKYYQTIVDKVQYLQSLYEEYQQQDIFKYAINPILELLQYYDNKQHLLLKTIEASQSYRESSQELNNKQVKIILNVNQHIINDENIVYQRIIKKIIYNIQKQNISNMKHLRIGNKQFGDSIKIIMERLREFKNRIQYQIQFKQFSNKVIEKLSISQNDKYLAVITNYCEINVIDISQNQIIKQKKVCGRINMIQFDQTSNFLIVSYTQELSFYQFKRGFKCIKKLSTFILNNFIQISLIEIIIYNSYQVKIIDFKNSSLLQLDTRKPFEYSLALDYDKTNKIIVTSGLDGKIRIFDGITGKLLITKQVKGNNVVIM